MCSLTWPIMSIVLHGERTTELRILGPFELVRPINHFRKGTRTPAMSRIDVKVFSSTRATTCNMAQKNHELKKMTTIEIQHNNNKGSFL